MSRIGREVSPSSSRRARRTSGSDVLLGFLRLDEAANSSRARRRGSSGAHRPSTEPNCGRLRRLVIDNRLQVGIDLQAAPQQDTELRSPSAKLQLTVEATLSSAPFGESSPVSHPGPACPYRPSARACGRAGGPRRFRRHGRRDVFVELARLRFRNRTAGEPGR